MSAFYDQASLVVVPSGYKSGKIYAQKPLTTDGQLTFTRASTATRVNTSGLIETVASGVPRLDYTNSTCPKLLLEPQRTNSLLYSNDFTHSSWQKSTATITGSQSDPFNGTAAFKLELAAGLSYIYQPAGTGQRTNSIWMRADAPLFVGFSSGGTIGNGVNITTTWQRYTYTHSDLGGLQIDNYFFSGQPVQQAKTLYIYQAQVEAGAYATSPIFTTTAAVTRLADFPVNLPTAISLSGDFTLFWEGTALESDIMLYGSGNSTWYANVLGSAGRVVLDTTTGRKVQVTSASLTVGTKAKIAIRRQGGAHNIFVNGVKLTNQVSVNDTATLSLSSMFWGISSTFYKGQTVNQSLIFKTALTDSQAIELTTL
jgi:hypothetical protein